MLTMQLMEGQQRQKDGAAAMVSAVQPVVVGEKRSSAAVAVNAMAKNATTTNIFVSET